MNIEQAISKVVRHEMITLGLSIKAISKCVDLCPQTISNQLAGRTAWSVERIYQFSQQLNLTGSELLELAERLQKLTKEAAK
mgnify:CR=1 FL=1|jgi:plasmid maintenance system antidote protein VapI